MKHLSREELEIVAKALTSYKKELGDEISSGTDLEEYNRIEMSRADELAEKLDLDPEYYQPGNPKRQTKKSTIQVIDITAQPAPRFCPICGEKIMDTAKMAKKVCPHILFVGTSEGGAEYCSSRVRKLLPEEPWFEDYKKLPFPNAVLIVEGLPAPAGLELYIGITPDEPETAAKRKKK